MKAIGPTFEREMRAAGIDIDGVCWGADGVIQFLSHVTQQTKDAVQAVYEAHDPEAGTTEILVGRLTEAMQRKMDATARANGYDDIRSAISYRGDANPVWAAQAEAFFAWRSACWSYGLGLMNAVLAGQAPIPTEAELLAGMPALVFQ